MLIQIQEYFVLADNLGLTTNGVEGLRLRENSNVSIGATYASTNAAPANGLRIEGHSVIGKASGEDTRDVFFFTYFCFHLITM